MAHDHHEEDDSQTPYVGRLSEIASSTLDLGGHVEDRPALLREEFGLAGLGVGHFCGKAKVSDPDFQILTNEDVVEFQVAVADVLGMHVGNSGNDLLGEEVATDVFGESTDLGDDVKKFVLAVLKSENLSAILLVRELYSDQLNDVGMSQQTQRARLRHKLFLVPYLNVLQSDLLVYCLFVHVNNRTGGLVHVRSQP